MKPLKLNAKQAEHLASTLRAYGLGQIAAFGYTGIQTGHWLLVIVSGALALAAEAAAMTLLKNSEDEK